MTFDEESYNDTEKPNCLDLRIQYSNMWTHSIQMSGGNQTIFNEYGDPFKLYDNIIAVTEEINHAFDDGTINRYALFGIHFNTNIFRRTIDPLLASRERDYVTNVYYWVYPIRQFVLSNCTLPSSEEYLVAVNDDGAV